MASIIDFGLSTQASREFNSDFKVDVSYEFSISSDHVLLVITLKMEVSAMVNKEKEYLHIRNIRHYKKTVKATLASLILDTKQCW